MRIPVLPPFLLLCLSTCVAPVEYQPWSEDTLSLASSVEKEGEDLTTAMLAFFIPGSEEYQTARNLGGELQQEYARQVMAWRVLESYLSDVDLAISLRAPNTTAMRGIGVAFHQLHVRLLQTGIAPSFGITVEQHEEAMARILAGQSVAEAMEAAHPVVAIMCKNLAQSCSGLASDLGAGETVAMNLLAQRWGDEAAARDMLLARQVELRNIIAMVAAGAGEASGDPEQDLAEVEQLLASTDEWYADYTAQRRAVSEMFRDHIDFARKSSHAVLEWGIGHREVVKALKRGDDHANLRLFSASVEELTR
ncbi:MAG: hypothetical protein GY747_08305 [Planctomycetes bacterium]|nr:hypothetical protein [Planctomycetota bacterium]MCP4771185.1 hypothetical protein [Planctomycetota bacterium]MCP4862088.1 hypothetical protein [Planctomycetota bacterium]